LTRSRLDEAGAPRPEPSCRQHLRSIGETLGPRTRSRVRVRRCQQFLRKRNGQRHPRRVPQRAQIRQVILERPVERAGLARVTCQVPSVPAPMSPAIAMVPVDPLPAETLMVNPLIGLSKVTVNLPGADVGAAWMPTKVPFTAPIRRCASVDPSGLSRGTWRPETRSRDVQPENVSVAESAPTAERPGQRHRGRVERSAIANALQREENACVEVEIPSRPSC